MYQIKLLTSCIFLVLLCACSDNKDNNARGGDQSEIEYPSADSSGTAPVSTYSAAIVTVDPTFLGGAIQIAHVDYVNNLVELTHEVVSTDQSDYAIGAYGDYFYHIGRYQIDVATKYAFTEPSVQLWSGNFGEGYDLLLGEIDSNTYQMVFVDENKAYMIRYGSTKVWIVNPSASNEDNFKIGELDLSAYADSDESAYGQGVSFPEMNAGIIIDGKLFIVMQRLKDWCPEDTAAYVAVFDTHTDMEIDINSDNDPLGLKGIQLEVRNPYGIDYHEDIGLVIAGVGAGTIFSCAPANLYSGGLETVNPVSYKTTLLLDDGDTSSHPYDFISDVVILDKNNGYFNSYADWGNTRLYHFNPSTADVTGVVKDFGDSQQIDIRFLSKGPDNTAWIGVAQSYNSSNSSPKMFILDKNQKEVAQLTLERDPTAIAFTVNKN